jgi:hypothetical protein
MSERRWALRQEVIALRDQYLGKRRHRMNKWKLMVRSFFATVAACLFLSAPLSGQDPYAEPDDTWISLTGTVESVMADQFTLKYSEDGEESWIIVEMDDGDRDADGYKLMAGDLVTVNGIIDDDLFETRTIEASSVYVANLDTYFYASAADEEDAFVTVTVPMEMGDAVVQGVVTEVNEHEFTLDTGLREVTVDVAEMPYDPLDDVGYQQIDVGDAVSVFGEVDYDFFDGREVMASSVTTLWNG